MLEFAAGECAQVDWGQYGSVPVGTTRRRLSFFVMVRLKYHNSIADAVADLGKPEEIGKVFAGFQQYLYATTV